MSLVNCPSCQAKISNKSKQCLKCGLNFHEITEDDVQRAKKLKFRRYRDRMYVYKMLSFVAIAIATFGAVPMLWKYIRAIDYGFTAQLTNHWGISLIIIGFFLYVFIRILMIVTKRNFKNV